MMKILKARGPTQIRFRLGRDERIFFEKHWINKRNYLNRWVVERTLKATQLRLNAPCVATLVVDWLAHSESSLRKSGCWSESNSGPHSSLYDNVQYHGQVPLDGSHRKSQVYTLPAILLVLEEAPWSGLDFVWATVGVNPHISRGWGQFVGIVFEFVVADMVVVDNVGTVVCWNKGVSQVTYWVLTITRY